MRTQEILGFVVIFSGHFISFWLQNLVTILEVAADWKKGWLHTERDPKIQTSVFHILNIIIQIPLLLFDIKEGWDHAVVYYNIVQKSINYKVQTRSKPDFISSTAHGSTFLNTFTKIVNYFCYGCRTCWVWQSLLAQPQKRQKRDTLIPRQLLPRKQSTSFMWYKGWGYKLSSPNSAPEESYQCLKIALLSTPVPGDLLRWAQQHVNSKMWEGFKPAPKLPRDMIKRCSVHKDSIYLEKSMLSFGAK